MIKKSIVNQMTDVELRNYVEILCNQIVTQQEMIHTQDDLISALLNLYNQESRKSDAMIELNVKASVLGGFQREMEERYTEPEQEQPKTDEYAPELYAEFVKRAEANKSNFVYADLKPESEV